MSYAETASAVMVKTLLKCREEGKSPEDSAKAIDAAYPFGERAHWPYKAWLNERRKFFAAHGLPRNGDRKTQKERLGDLVSRMSAQRGWA